MEDGFYPDRAESAPLDAALHALATGGVVVISDTPDVGATMIMDAAQVSDAAINFMATHGRGLIGVAVTPGRAARMGLTLQPRRNHDRAGPAYTYSVEARVGVSTGISAADRALTIRVLADPRAQGGDLVTPGHIFPQIALGSETDEAPSCAELAVALLRAAGCPPVAVTCSLLTASGAAATPRDARALAEAHDLPCIGAAELATLPRSI